MSAQEPLPATDATGETLTSSEDAQGTPDSAAGDVPTVEGAATSDAIPVTGISEVNAARTDAGDVVDQTESGDGEADWEGLDADGADEDRPEEGGPAADDIEDDVAEVVLDGEALADDGADDGADEDDPDDEEDADEEQDSEDDDEEDSDEGDEDSTSCARTAAGGAARGKRPLSRERTQQLEREGEIAADFLERLLDIADMDGDIDVDIDGDRAAVAIVDSEDGRVPRRLVGQDGKVLEALQELARLAVQAETGDRSRLMLDVAGHRAGRRRLVIGEAREAIAEIRAGADRVAMKPMTAFERKVVHDEILAAGLVSESDGSEPGRFVVVYPA